MHGDRRVDEIAAERPEAGKSAILVRSGEPAETDDVGSQDRCKFPGLAHGAFAEAGRSRRGGFGMAALPCCTGRTWKQEVQVLRVGSRSLSTPRLSISPSMREE